MKRFLIGLFVLALLLAACGPQKSPGEMNCDELWAAWTRQGGNTRTKSEMLGNDNYLSAVHFWLAASEKNKDCGYTYSIDRAGSFTIVKGNQPATAPAGAVRFFAMPDWQSGGLMLAILVGLLGSAIFIILRRRLASTRA